METEVRHVRIADLKPFERNPKVHSDAQVGRIAASIIEFGFINPVLVSSELGVIAGHGRILAAKSLGMETVPCLAADHLTPKQVKAYIIADNATADSPWSDVYLWEMVGELSAEGVNLNAIGFNETALRDLLNEVPDDVGFQEPTNEEAFTPKIVDHSGMTKADTDRVASGKNNTVVSLGRMAAMVNHDMVVTIQGKIRNKFKANTDEENLELFCAWLNTTGLVG